MSKYGAVSWDETLADSSAGKKNSKDSFLRLGAGSNVVRLLTKPYQYYQHKYKIEGEKGFGHRIACSAIEHKVCAVCEKQDKPKRRWLLGVIDRKTNTYKILDIGYSIFKAIQTLAKDDDWGDPSKYDVDIVVDPNGGATGYYTVVAKPPKPLSASDMSIRDDNNPEELDRRVTPPTPDKVQEKLQKLIEEAASNGVAVNTNTVRSTAVASSDEDDDVEFQNFDDAQKAPF